MARILIYLEKEFLLPKGGPYAVGYFINEALKKLGVKNIDFIEADKSVHQSLKSSFLGRNKYLVKVFRIIRNYRNYSRILNGQGFVKTNISDYDVVHFHKSVDMYAARNVLKDYKGRVILTSHSPVPLSQEIYDGLQPIEKVVFKKLYSKLPIIDEYAFRRADIIHFPCPEAEESYIKHMAGYTAIKKEKANGYYYLPTGILPCKPKRTREDVCKELSIPKHNFIISYVGRHNAVKGYGKLKEIGEYLLNNDKQIWMVIAGREGPMMRYEHSHWIEVGFTNDAHSYISAADIFVLPNEETYFDIVMLEVLSLGKIIVASRTGGNKYFEGKSEGIFLYDTMEEAVSIINDIKNMPVEQRIQLEQANKTLFDMNFTNDVYTQNYVEFLNSL